MSNDLAERRKGRALLYFLIAGAMAAAAAVTLAIESRGSRSNAMSGPVVPGLAESIAGGRRITIVSAEGSYRIEQTSQGVWVLRDRGDYPVLASRLNQLTQGLRDLSYVRRMTSDPSKHARLGVDDPERGGRGVLVRIEDGRGALLVNLIIGIEPNGGLYARRPDGDQTWAVRGELPPLRDVATWLDLAPLTLGEDRFARVEIQPMAGRGYVLARDSAGAPWRIASPALAPLSQSTVNATATRLLNLRPVDVMEAPAIQGDVRARVRATTFDGINIDGELIHADERTWLKLVARADAPEQEAAALAINDRSAGWAYGLSALEAEALAPALGSLVPGAN